MPHQGKDARSALVIFLGVLLSCGLLTGCETVATEVETNSAQEMAAVDPLYKELEAAAVAALIGLRDGDEDAYIQLFYPNTIEYYGNTHPKRRGKLSESMEHHAEQLGLDKMSDEEITRGVTAIPGANPKMLRSLHLSLSMQEDRWDRMSADERDEWERQRPDLRAARVTLGSKELLLVMVHHEGTWKQLHYPSFTPRILELDDQSEIWRRVAQRKADDLFFLD
jgi:hypothetical protein